jgi:hypothetical protein
MMIKPLDRDYTLSDSELLLFASGLLSLMNRDSVQFSNYGILAADITALSDKADDFDEYPTDAEYKGLVTIAAQVKDAVRKQLHVEVRGVSDRAIIKWGAGSGQYKRFEVKDLANMPDKDLLFAARRTLRIGTEYLSDLTDEGLTQAILDSLEALAQDFEDKINALRDSVSVRDTKTEERIGLGNELYALVAKYCEIGKIIWKETSEARYNDYIIYPTVHGGLGKVLSLAYDVPTKTADWDALQFAVDYQLEYRPHTEGSEWMTAWEGAGTSTVHDPGAGSWYYRCRGNNAEGYGDWSDELEVILPS